MIETTQKMTNAVIGSTESKLEEIHDADKNIAIYEREIKVLAKDTIRVMESGLKFETNGTVEEIKATLTTYFEQQFTMCTALLTDMIKLVSLFDNVAGSTTYRVLLATVNTDMCRRFHTDINDLRMLCTYNGPGTLWLTEDNINRSALETDDDENSIAIDHSQIQQAKTGDVLILKGAIYPKAGTQAIVHRSPTIEESGTKRLLFRIDTNDFLSFLK